MIDPLNSTTFDLRKVRKALGVRTRLNFPWLISSHIFQTITVADVSQSFAPEPFEARGFTTPLVGAFAGEVSVAQLIVNSDGGAVVERIDIFSEDNFGVVQLQCGLQVGPRSTLNNLTNPVLIDVGGQPITSVVEQGSLVVPGSAAVIVLDVNGRKTFENFNWFIPSGSTLRVRTALPDIRLFVTMQFRELPA